ISRLAVKVLPRKGPGPNVRSSSWTKSYSSFADQFPAIAHSTPAPTTQPRFRLDALIEAPVVRFVMVALLSTHPPPALPYRSTPLLTTTPNLAASVDIQRVFADPCRVPKPGTKRPFPVASSDVQSKSHSAPRTMLLNW